MIVVTHNVKSIGGRFGGLMKLSHPVWACDEAIYFKFVQKSIAPKPSIMDMIKGGTKKKEKITLLLRSA
eukprot:COSAG05_NODE_3051_length_2382_cov_2.250986_3_plen_69_part_00